MNPLRSVMAGQVALSRRLDRMVPANLRRDGHKHYIDEVVPHYLKPDIRLYDVGGGKRPFLSAEQKHDLHAFVTGIDIDGAELARAPQGAYDRTVTADIATIRGDADGDLVVCQAVFEHVQNVEGATKALASLLTPGGAALVFVPCRNAAFARLNLLIPERLKRRLLFALYPRMEEYQGFPSYYRHCTPSGLARLARDQGLDVEQIVPSWTSAYFEAFFPAYALWRMWTIVASTLKLKNCCESFSIVLRKPVEQLATVGD